MGRMRRESYGRVGREAASVVDAVAALVEGFDPDVTGARDAMDLVAELSRLEHLASAGVALAARRVAQTDLWRRGGHRSAAHWLAAVTGMSVGEAVRLLQTAEAVEAAPDTRDALKAGEVSVRQARAIGAAEAVDPGAGLRLLAAAGNRSTKETEDDAARIVAAASTESPDEKAQRHRNSRRFRHGMTAEGMGWGSWLLPPAEHTRAVAQIEGEQAKVFTEARAAGLREPVEAYAADAFCRILDRAGRRAQRSAPAETTDTGAVADAEADGADWSFTKVIVRVDLTALDRGHLEPGEVCEIAGKGPVPVADVWRMIDGGAFVAAVTTNGTEIDEVVHLGRRPTALQRTALEWFHAGECSLEGCTSPACIEIDHVTPWADTHTTTLTELTGPCRHHHDLKTHHGYRFGPRLPTGKRQLIPPDSADPPDPPDPPGPPGQGPAQLALIGGPTTPTGRATQGDLFDTG